MFGSKSAVRKGRWVMAETSHDLDIVVVKIDRTIDQRRWCEKSETLNAIATDGSDKLSLIRTLNKHGKTPDCRSGCSNSTTEKYRRGWCLRARMVWCRVTGAASNDLSPQKHLVVFSVQLEWIFHVLCLFWMVSCW